MRTNSSKGNNASYSDRTILQLQLKANQVEEFESRAFDLLRGDLIKLNANSDEHNTA